MAHSEARSTDTEAIVSGLEVTEAQLSPAEYLELMNGPARADVPHIKGERVIEMRGTVPPDWALS